MSTQEDKEKRSKRLHKDDAYMERQYKIAKSHGFPVKEDEKHRMHKLSGTTCGDSNCHMCGNPRKFFSELTVQEKKFIQTERWFDDQY